MRNPSAAVAVLAFALSAFAFAGEKDGIIGGEAVKAGDPVASSTVLIVDQTSARMEYLCSGSLIARDMIVTAAHCVASNIKKPADPAKLALVFSLRLPKTEAQAREIPILHAADYVHHPEWKGAVNGQVKGDDAHDIAVVHFNGELPPGYAPAALPDPSVPLAEGAQVTLAGYGQNSASDKSDSSGVLRKVSGVLVERSLGPTEVLLNERERGGIGSAEGDSGGPAFFAVHGKNFLWGVDSRGDDGKEEIYTRVMAYSDFIGSAEESLRSGSADVAAASPADGGRERQRQAVEGALRVAGAVLPAQ